NVWLAVVCSSPSFFTTSKSVRLVRFSSGRQRVEGRKEDELRKKLRGWLAVAAAAAAAIASGLCSSEDKFRSAASLVLDGGAQKDAHWTSQCFSRHPSLNGKHLPHSKVFWH